jgi:uncharacterized protein (TIGR02996 family)
MVATADAILAAVIAEPWCDLHRLAYADWIEERGDDARAEFIRVQCGLARPARCEWEAEDGAPCPRYNARRPDGRLQLWCPTCAAREKALPGLRHRERWLLTAIREALAAELPTSRPGCHAWGLYLERHAGDIDDEFTVGFARGFAAVVTLPCAAWLARGPALVRAAPLERVTLSDRRPQHGLTGAGEEYWAWGWYADRRDHPPPGCLPSRLWRDSGALGRRYPSEASALADASRMALAWARAGAGLPPLPAPVAPPPPAG